MKSKIILGFSLCLISIVLNGCSVQSKLSRRYDGKKEQVLAEQMGNPISVVKLENGKKVAVYEKRTELRKTPINTGQFQYDPFLSPRTTKIETYKFEINSSGVIDHVDYDYRYEQ